MAKAKMEEYYAEALEALAKVSVPEEKKAQLRDYAAKMMREKNNTMPTDTYELE